MAADYFDILPVHPQPQPLESLTGYLTRLAQANAIRSPFHLAAFFCPDGNPANPPPATDHPRTSWGHLPRLTACSEARLRQTTFHHLALKFNLPLQAEALGHFLTGSLTPYLRYCPLCLQTQRPYYRLTWRFLALTGCSEHGCRLLTACPNCGQTLPLLAAPLQIGVCPTCGPTLPTAPIRALAEADLSRVRQVVKNLAFLLSPHPVDPAPPEALGPRLAWWRQSQGVSLTELAVHLGQPAAYLRLFERRLSERRFKFSLYLAYALHFGQPLSDLFQENLWPPLEPYQHPHSPRVSQQRQADVLDRVRRAVATLETEQVPVTQSAICRQVGLSLMGLRRYPQVKAFLTALAQHQRQLRHQQTLRREEKLLEQIPAIIAALHWQGQPVTQQAIADQVGLSPTTLQRYPQLQPLLLQIKQAYHLRPSPVPAEPSQLLSETEAPPVSPANLVEQVRQAIATLQAQEQPVTQAALSRLLKWPVAWFSRQPALAWVAEACRQDAQTRRHQREQRLVEQVRQAMLTLTAQGQLLTQPAICQLTGLGIHTLRSYPQVRSLLQQARQVYQEQRHQQAQLREQQLLDRLNRVVAEWPAQSAPLTKRALSFQLGMSVSALERYPRLKDRLNQVTTQTPAPPIPARSAPPAEFWVTL